MNTDLTEQLEECARHRRSLGMRPNTIRAELYNTRAFLRELSIRHQAHTAESLRPEMLEDWQRHLSARRTTKGRPLKARSINKKIECVRIFLKHLVARRLIQSALTDTLQYIKEPFTLPTSVLAHAQVRKLLSVIAMDTPEGCRDRAMLELLYSSGIRAGELISLDLGDIDYQNRTLRVTGKGGKERVVPVGRTALRHLETYTKAVRPFLARQPGSSALFITRTGERIKHHIIARRLSRYTRVARLDVNVTPHTFRRSCTTELIRGGANLYHVKEFLGHESLDTVRHYARLTIADLKETHAKCHPRERDERI